MKMMHVSPWEMKNTEEEEGGGNHMDIAKRNDRIGKGGKRPGKSYQE